MSVQPEGHSSLASFLLFREKNFIPESLPPCPPADLPVCLTDHISAPWPPLDTREAGKQESGFFSRYSGKQARKKGTGQEQLTESICHNTLLALNRLGLHGQADTETMPIFQHYAYSSLGSSTCEKISGTGTIGPFYLLSFMQEEYQHQKGVKTNMHRINYIPMKGKGFSI